MALQFQDKVVIVTGSSSGIGQGIALLLAERGASITLCGRDETRLQQVLEQCDKASGGHPERFITVSGDVTDRKVRQKILDETVSVFGRLDVLIPNAGISPSRCPPDDENVYDKIMDTNLKSVYFLIQSALPLLEKTKGNIVCISSVASAMAVHLFMYAMSKAALDHMVRCMAVTYGPKSIRINAVSPTYVPTRLTEREDKAAGDAVKQFLNEFAKGHPLRGQPSTVEEQAEVVAFLASDNAGFVTGQIVEVDGGSTLGRRP